MPSGGRKQPEPEINVTPLVDVVLVLLIIFMVIAPQLEHGERVELPAVQRPDPKPKGKMDPITVTVGSSGKIFWEKEPVEREVLLAKLAATKTAEPDRRVVLKGDANLPYAKVRDVFALIQNSGFNGVALLVSKKGKGNEKDDEES
jgi:biopolymer transport protein ExbD/biopolymer transport protein TolR